MSIRLIALELYRLEKEVSVLEKELASAQEENRDELPLQIVETLWGDG